MTSTPNDVNVRLKSRMATDRRQIEEAAASELRQLGVNLRAVAIGALHTIEADTGVSVRRTRVILLNAWLRPLVVGLVIFVAISDGTWGLMSWLSTGIQHRIETLATLDVQIEDARETLAEMEETTWGVTLLEIDGERFVLLPQGTPVHPARTVGGRPVLKLSSE